MQTIFAAIIDAGGDLIVEKAAVQCVWPQAGEPGCSGSFRIDPGRACPVNACDSIWFRMPTGDEFRAVVSAVCLGEVFFSSISTPNEQRLQ
jgi:hypothetical protein